MACSIVGAKILQKMWDGPYQEGFWPCRDPWDIVRLRTPSSYWNVRGEYGPYSELFFFLITKELVALTKVVPLKPAVPAETLKAGALIGLRGSSSTGGVLAPELGGIPGLSGPRYPLWKDDVPGSGSEVTSWL